MQNELIAVMIGHKTTIGLECLAPKSNRIFHSCSKPRKPEKKHLTLLWEYKNMLEYRSRQAQPSQITMPWADPHAGSLTERKAGASLQRVRIDLVACSC